MGGVVSAVGGFVKGAVNAVADVAGGVVKAGINTVAGIAKVVTKPLDWVAPGLYKEIDSKISGVQNFANGVVDGATGFVKGVAGAAVDMALLPSQIAANAIEGAWNALTGGDDDKADQPADKPKAAGAGAKAPAKKGWDFTPPFNGTPRDVGTLADLARYGRKDDAIQAIRELGARAKAGDKEALKLLLETAPATGFRRGDAVVAAALSMLKDVPDPAAKAALSAFANEKTNDPDMRDLARRALG